MCHHCPAGGAPAGFCDDLIPLRCPTCHGEGDVPCRDGHRRCPTCQGSGAVADDAGLDEHHDRLGGVL